MIYAKERGGLDNVCCGEAGDDDAPSAPASGGRPDVRGIVRAVAPASMRVRGLTPWISSLLVLEFFPVGSRGLADDLLEHRDETDVAREAGSCGNLSVGQPGVGQEHFGFFNAETPHLDQWRASELLPESPLKIGTRNAKLVQDRMNLEGVRNFLLHHAGRLFDHGILDVEGIG